MKDFLEVVTAAKALNLIQSFPAGPRPETVSVDGAWTRILAADIIADEPIPHFSRSTVDGYAVKAKDTLGAKDHSPAPLRYQGEVRVAEKPSLMLQEGSCIYVNTGSMIPDGADAVLMQEHARRSLDLVEVTRIIRKGENIFSRGEDIATGELVLQQGKRLSFSDVGVLAALGISKVPVFQRPLCAIISSGDEIVPVEEQPVPGTVRDINRYTVAAILARYGARPHFAGIARDNMKEVCSILKSCKDFDTILVSGGSSKGERDFIIDAIEDLGGRIVFHGVNVKPGKPTIFGEVWGKPIFGLPGHPLSCLMATVRFVVPLLRLLTGMTDTGDRITRALLATNVPSSPGIEEYVGVILRGKGKGFTATPVFTRSSAISPLARASGYIIIPASSEGLEKGEEVEVRLFD
jgi:molybdopterin molybdotransferase